MPNRKFDAAGTSYVGNSIIHVAFERLVGAADTAHDPIAHRDPHPTVMSVFAVRSATLLAGRCPALPQLWAKPRPMPAARKRGTNPRPCLHSGPLFRASPALRRAQKHTFERPLRIDLDVHAAARMKRFDSV